MSSSSDAYQHLCVPVQPKSILKHSPSPKFQDSWNDLDCDRSTDAAKLSIFEPINTHTDNDESLQRSKDDFLNKMFPIDQRLIETMKLLNENNTHFIGKTFRFNSGSFSSTSDDEQQRKRRVRIKSRKNYIRSTVPNGILSQSSSSSSSDDNIDRQGKYSKIDSKTALIRSIKQPSNDRQLNEPANKYQYQDGIHVPTQQSINEQSVSIKGITKFNKTNDHSLHQNKQKKSDTLIDTMNLLHSLNTITSKSKSSSPIQLLFDLARKDKNEYDRRTKIDRIREYVEEEIGISAFLTIYKLIKSSTIQVDIQQKPFCYYANYIPHLCCLILLENSQ